MTRADYMTKKVDHRAYYASIVKAAGIRFPANHPLVKRARRSQDEHYNDIPLQEWDQLAAMGTPALRKAFKEHEDFFSLAGGVCAYKEAVRQAVERAAEVAA